MLIGCRVNQLYVHPHAIARTADTAFENRRDAKGLSDFADIRRGSAVRHERRARDYLQISDFRKVRKNVVLDSVSEISVLFCVTQILERQNGDRLVDLVRRCAW